MTTPGVIGVVLAGGLGRRMGGADKGLVQFEGRTLVEHVLSRLEPQVARLVINANRNTAAYRAFGHPVVSDRETGFNGPLAGMAAALSALETGACTGIVTVPCDAPFLPADLTERLLAASGAPERGAVASCGGRWQPVFAYVPAVAGSSLEAYLAAGGRKIDRWFESEGFGVAEFEDEAAFRNLNAPEDLAACARRSA